MASKPKPSHSDNLTKSRPEEDTLISIFEDTIKRLELELKEAKENHPKPSDEIDHLAICGITEDIKSLARQLEEKSKELGSLQLKKESTAKKGDDLRAPSGKEEFQKLKKENEDYKRKVAELQLTIADLQRKNSIVEPRGPSSSGEVSKLRKEIIGLKDENDHLKTRLSELVGVKLTKDNPDIADFTDMIRPQKLGEMYSELYDNEWTDAFEEIESSGESESVAIKHLHTILWEASGFCEELSSQYFMQLNSVLFRIPGGRENNVETSEMPVAIRNDIIDLRKRLSSFLKANVSEKYVLTSKEKKIGENLKQFMKRCAELCWLMQMQDPPVVLAKKNNAGPFNGDLYRIYTKSGKTVDFVVWPPLLLHDNGPTLAKGVAQGK